MAAAVQKMQNTHVNQSGPTDDLHNSLYEAAERGDVKEVERTGIAGANLYYQEGQRGYTALHIASENGHVPVVNYLLHYGARVATKDRFQQTALHKSCMNGHTEVTKALIDADIPVNSRDKVKGYTALHHAAYHGHKACVEALIAGGCNVNAKCLWKQDTPLELASARGHMDIVQLLIKHGAAASKGLF